MRPFSSVGGTMFDRQKDTKCPKVRRLALKSSTFSNKAETQRIFILTLLTLSQGLSYNHTHPLTEIYFSPRATFFLTENHILIFKACQFF